MHEKAPKEKAEAIAALGATVVRTPGSYDDSVRQARAEVSKRTDWILVPDTTDDPDDPTPAEVMQGYVVMALELFETARGPPTHLFVQAGVGGLASGAPPALSPRSMARVVPLS
jgi:diaminopropionate ammonia-lyase